MRQSINKREMLATRSRRGKQLLLVIVRVMLFIAAIIIVRYSYSVSSNVISSNGKGVSSLLRATSPTTGTDESHSQPMNEPSSATSRASISDSNKRVDNNFYTDMVTLGKQNDTYAAKETKQGANLTATSTQNNSTSATPWPGRVDHIVDSRNRIVILIATCPYLEMLDNMIGSMRKVNVSNFVVVPLDETTHNVSCKLYPDNTVSIPPFTKLASTLEPATYGSKEFQALTASRPVILSAFLNLGYTVFYCDIDTVDRKSVV